MLRSSHVALVAALASFGAAGCQSNNPVLLAVIAPDGGDPFLGPDAATQVRILVEDDATPPHLEPVAANGSFQLQIAPGDVTRRSRVRLEALNNGAVTATGATPPIGWVLEGGQAKAVLMHFRDTLIPGPVRLAVGRADFELYALDPQRVVALTVPSGTTTAVSPDGYDLGAHARFPTSDFTVPSEFDGQTTVLPIVRSDVVQGAWLLLRGASEYVYTGDSSGHAQMLAAAHPRAALTSGTAVIAADLGGWIVGGHDGSGARSRQVDRVNSGDGTLDTAPMLAVPRDHPTVLRVIADGSVTPARWLVANGHDATSGTLLESYGPADGSTSTALHIDATTDSRTGAALVCIASVGDICTRIAVLGGNMPDGTLAPTDLLLDGTCVLTPSSTCQLVVGRGEFFHQRRTGARVALAEGGRLVVAGGHGADGLPMFTVETIDVTTPGSPTPGRVVGSMPCADPAVLAVSNGSVMLAGGRCADGSASREIWFYRF